MRKLSTSRVLLSVLLSLTLVLPTAACKSGRTVEKTETEKAVEETYGRDWAVAQAQAHPYRGAYSADEQAVLDAVEAELKRLGYRPERQTFAAEGAEDKKSSNIFVHIEGSGFRQDPEGSDPLDFMNRDQALPAGEWEEDISGAKVTWNVGPSAATAQAVEGETAEAKALYSTRPGERRLIYLAHVDSPVTEAHKEDYPQYTGVTELAGAAVLLDTARKLKGRDLPYSLDLVFCGASYDKHRGATIYRDHVMKEKIPVDAVVVLGQMGGGDKLYAHSGHNSLLPNRKYNMRRKLYTLTDIYLNEAIYDRFEEGLYTNQAGFMVTVPGFEEQKYYREFSLRDGDYAPFDSQGYPIVFLDAGDYKIDKVEGFLETRRIKFRETGGWISASNFDNIEAVDEGMPENHFRRRINAVSEMLMDFCYAAPPGMIGNN